MILEWRNKRPLVDRKKPTGPHFLASEDLLARKNNQEIFIKHIFSLSEDLPKRGPVIMSPGVSTNANLFRVDDRGDCLALDHNRSFANLMAAAGFQVYLYHPGYCDRVRNRYVSRHCEHSIYYHKRYRVPPGFDYSDMINIEIPAVISLAREHSQSKHVSWIGYSLGGMIAYSYLAKNPVNSIKNLITIGTPMALNQLFFRFVPFINFTSSFLGFEEDAVLGNITQNMVPLTRAIRALPNWFLRFNLLAPFLYNPLNMTSETIRTMLGKIVEPMPKGLQQFFSKLIQRSYSSEESFADYLGQLRRLKRTRKNFLFIYGANDLIATPESVFLAREIISPNDPNNLVAVPAAGHVDLIVGKNALERVWQPALEWLKERV